MGFSASKWVILPPSKFVPIYVRWVFLRPFRPVQHSETLRRNQIKRDSESSKSGLSNGFIVIHLYLTNPDHRWWQIVRFGDRASPGGILFINNREERTATDGREEVNYFSIPLTSELSAVVSPPNALRGTRRVNG